MAKQSFDRRSPHRKIRQKVLIVCEGEKTEPLYFKGIRNDRRLQTLTIQIINAAGKTDPLNIVACAVKERKNIQATGSWQTDDAVWAVFDGDEHRLRDRENWDRALALAEKQKIHLAITNPCFEFWYLLHYQNATSAMTAKQALQQLKKHLPNYDKAQTLYPIPLKDCTQDAIDRAAEIAQQIQRNQLSPHSNPCCSQLPDLVKLLLDLP